MTLTFDNFKREIPQSVLTRGREYYQLGLVVDLEEDGDDGWTAEVQGTMDYCVTLKQRSDQSLETSCPCPYAYGEHCKHIAAMLYAIEDIYPELFKGKRRNKAVKRPSKHDRLRTALEAATPQQLVKILLDTAKGNREFQSYLLMELGVTDNSSDIRGLVKEMLRPPRGNHGFLDYWAATNAGIKVGELVSRADEIRGKNPNHALTMYQVVLEETINGLANADDSSGVLSSNADRAIEGLIECADLLAPESRAALFKYCLKTAVNPKFQGWDYGWNLFSVAAELVDTTADRNKLYASMESLQEENQMSSAINVLGDLAQTRIAAIKLAVITRLDGEDEALKFIIAHKHLTMFRALLIEHYIQQEDLDMALALIQEGQDALDGEGGYRLGIAFHYRQYILEIAQKRGDTKTIIEQARALWLGLKSQDYFHLMKEMIPSETWPEFRDTLLADKTCTPDLVAWACAEEGLWPQLRDVALAHPYLLPPYQLEIENRFPHETAAAYKNYVNKLLDKTSNRDTYREAASFLIRMEKLGHGEEGKAMARRFIEMYPQRRAMIGELKRVL
jgi:hypothetical protein